MVKTSIRSQGALDKLTSFALHPPLSRLFIQVDRCRQSNDAYEYVHRFRHQSIPFPNTLQSRWITRLGGGGGTEAGAGSVGALVPVHFMGGAGMMAGGGLIVIGAIFGGGGKTYPWAAAIVAAHSIINAIATRIKTLLFNHCRPVQHCTRNWMEAIL